MQGVKEAAPSHKANEVNTWQLDIVTPGTPAVGRLRQGDYELWSGLATYNLAQENKTHDSIVSYFQCFFSP